MPDDATIKSLIKKYCTRAGIIYPIKDNHICFLRDAEKLDIYSEEIFLKKYARNYPVKIIVNDISNMIGAGCPIPMIDFVDVSSGKIKKLVFDKKAPAWRKVNEGLNIFGICNNSKCKAFKKEIVYPTKLEEKLIFNLNEQLLNIKCPICDKIIKPKTCGFWKCEYQFVGKKIQEGDLVEFDSKTMETKGNDFEYYDAFKNGETQWMELIIYVLPKQEIKYEKN